MGSLDLERSHFIFITPEVKVKEARMDYEHDSMRDMKRVRDLTAKSLRKGPLVKVKIGQENGKNSGTCLMVYSDIDEVTLGCVTSGSFRSNTDRVVSRKSSKR